MAIINDQIVTTELLFGRAERMGLQPAWLTPKGAFVVCTSNGERYVNYSRSALNSHLGVSLSGNKYLTRLILDRHGLPNIPFICPTTIDEAKTFLATHQKIVVKPRRGSGARDIRIVDYATQLNELEIENYILEKYIPGREMR